MNKKEFTKQDIKNGAIVILRNGEKFIKIDKTLLELTMFGDYLSLEQYEYDLTRFDKDFDIMKVLNPRENAFFKEVCNTALLDYIRNPEYIKWTWERKEKGKIKLKDMTMEDYEKWLEKNCKGLNCRECPFRLVRCSDTPDGWINNKELYSEKFLNQEIEMEETK